MTKFTEHRSERRKATKDIIVLYHAECTDGFGAAWVAHRYFGYRAEYHPVRHQTPPPEGLVDKEVYMLDYTYPREITQNLMETNKRVTALDHHVSVKDVTKTTTDGVYDNEHSGVMIAWNYFFPNEEPPFLLKIIEDQDLYRHRYEETRPLIDWLDLYDFEFEKYDRLADDMEDPQKREQAVRQGNLIRQYQEKMVERLIANTSYEAMFEGYRVRVVNTEQFHSEVAGALADKEGIGVAWRVRPDGVVVSLRTQREDVNLSELASRYGGGGHAKSAGFTVPTVDDLPFKPIMKNDHD